MKIKKLLKSVNYSLLTLMFLFVVQVQALTIFQPWNETSGWVKEEQLSNSYIEVRPNEAAWVTAHMSANPYAGKTAYYKLLGDDSISSGTHGGQIPECWMQFDFTHTSSGVIMGRLGLFNSDGVNNDVPTDSSNNYIAIMRATEGGSYNDSKIYIKSKLAKADGTDVSYLSTPLYADTYNVRVKVHIYSLSAPDYNTYADVDVYDYDPATDTISSHTRTPTSLTRFIIAKSTDYYNHGLDAFGIRNNYRDTELNMNYKFDNLYFSTEGPLQMTYYYAGPTAQGNGSGSSWANRANFYNGTLWSGVQTQLNSTPVNVMLANGTYNGGELALSNRGNPRNPLHICANTLYGPVFTGDTYCITMRGGNNISLYGLKFSEITHMFPVYTQKIMDNPARNIELHYCVFENLGHSIFDGVSAFGILDGSYGIGVHNCDFENVGVPEDPNTPHMIYCDHDSILISVTDCTFTNGTGGYVRFRDAAEYVTVDNCIFNSTGSDYNRIFIELPVFNTSYPGQEYYGRYFKFTNNVFDYDSTSGSGLRHAVQFRCDGWNVLSGDTLDYMTDTTEASTLNNGTQDQKDALLRTEMELDNDHIKIYGNTYTNCSYQTVYWHHPNFGSGNQGYTGYCNISNWPKTSGTYPAPSQLRNNDFEYKCDRRRCWWTFSGTAPADHPGLHGARAVKLLRASTTEFGQWLSFPKSDTTVCCLFGVGARTGTGVKFQMQLHHNEISNSYCAFAVNSSGQLGYMNGSTFVAVPALGTIEFCVDGNGDGDYTDAGDTLRWYQLRIKTYYSDGTPTFDIDRGVANTQSSYNYQANGLTTWCGTAAVTNDVVGLVKFTNVTADVILDNPW